MTAGVFAKVAGAWVQVADPAGAGIPWAVVTGGTVTTVNNPDGSVDEVHTFTANGTLTVVEPGYADVLLVGAGSTGDRADGQGQPGNVNNGLATLPAGALPVVIGQPATVGGKSSLGALAVAVTMWGSAAEGRGAATGGDATGWKSSITGVETQYATGVNGAAVPGRAGWTANPSDARAGIVIVAVQKTPPTVSGVIASGGTETTYTGDGSNGVNGQAYKVHTFTANGTLTVTQGGECEVLVLGGGAAHYSADPGGGGDIRDGKVTLSPGATAVVVGAGGAFGAGLPSVLGQPSALGALATSLAGSFSGSGGTVADYKLGFSSYISGTLTEYGKAQTTPRANRGDGSDGGGTGNGSAGVVIIRYKV